MVEPSVHPKTGRVYVWLWHPRQGIADTPSWLLRELLDDEPQTSAEAQAKRPGSWNAGDANELVAEMVARFPVPGIAHRHSQMVRAVGSLVGREYEEGLIVEVLMGWWEHFHALGLLRTGRSGMRRELVACIRSTCRSVRFSVVKGDRWHRDCYRKIELDAGQRSRLRTPLAPAPDVRRGSIAERKGREGATSSHCKSVTLIAGRLCNSADEESFVEALIVHVTHKRIDLGEAEIMMIDDQVRQIAVDRRGAAWQPWSPEQMQRLKAKYITRPGKPATRCELLRMIRAGRPRRGHQPGQPSEYQATGIEALLKPEARRPAREPVISAA